MRIALDAMGGDFAPKINIDGAIEALRGSPDLELLLVGDQSQIEAQLADAGYSGERLSIVHSDSYIGMDEKPMDALRKKPGCSIATCWKLMAEKAADAVVSAGHTGGVVASGLRTKLFLKGVKRPGIAVVLPTLQGRAVLMDVGANPGARAEHLHQYAIMGSIFARDVLGIENPRFGLMNIGSEEGKGTEAVLETHELISRSKMPGQYVGNVEGRGLYLGEADVIICEGFVGNVVLKVSEGMASMMMKTISTSVLESLENEKTHAQKAFHGLKKRFEYNEVGGAPLLGVDGICLICHGSSDARAIRSALATAAMLHEKKINSKIIEHLGG